MDSTRGTGERVVSMNRLVRVADKRFYEDGIDIYGADVLFKVGTVEYWMGTNSSCYIVTDGLDRWYEGIHQISQWVIYEVGELLPMPGWFDDGWKELCQREIGRWVKYHSGLT